MDIYFFVNFILILFIVVIVAYNSVTIQEVSDKLNRYDNVFYTTARYQYHKINDLNCRLDVLASNNKKEPFTATNGQHDTPLGVVLDMYEDLLDTALQAATSDPYFRAISQRGEPLHARAIQEHGSLAKFNEFQQFIDKHHDMIHHILYKDMFATRFANVLKRRNWTQTDVDLLIDRVKLYEQSFQGIRIPTSTSS
jgi:hypothetical protein